MKLIVIFAILFSGCGFNDDSGNIEPSFNDGGTTGVGGSTARFTVVDDFLYIVNSNTLKVVNVSDEKNPVLGANIDLGWGIETIYPYGDFLFIGGQAGVQIFTINAAGVPTYLSDYTHTTACDPVIANSRYAYVTIRSGVQCNTNLFEANRLITLDISDIRSPVAVDEQQMINPRGLTFFKGDLFVGEGNSGLKRFSLTDPAHPEMIAFHDSIAANDMISLANTMIITRDEGIYQFGCVDDRFLLLSPLK